MPCETKQFAVILTTLAAAGLLASCTQSEPPQDFVLTPPTGAGSGGSPGTVLSTQSVPVSSAPQTIDTGKGVKVTIPGGLLTGATELRISTLEGALPGRPNSEEILVGYDVALGDLHELSQELTIEMAYDPAKLPPQSTIPAQVLLSPAYWDETQHEWIALPFSVDTVQHVVHAKTRHLCPISMSALKDSLAFKPPELNGSLMSTESPGSTLVWEEPYRFSFAFSRAEVDANTGPTAGWYTQGDATNPAIGTLPLYVKDAIPYFQHADQAYGGQNFLRPASQKVFISDVTSSSRSKLTGNITLRFTRDANGLKLDSAHEYFHSVQNSYFTWAGMSARKWWIEATADYAADRLAWGGLNAMGGENFISPRYLEKSLTYTSPLLSLHDVMKAATDTFYKEGLIKADPHVDHEYTTAYFVDFLVAKKGIAFKSLWDGVAAGGTDVRQALDAWLVSSRGTTLAAAYRDFARYWAFDPASPVRTRLKAGIGDVSDAFLSTKVDAATKDLSLTVALEAEHSAKVIALRSPPADPVRYFEVTVAALPADVGIDVYTSTAAEQFTLVGSIETSGQKIFAPFCHGTDVYLLAVNNSTSAQTVSVQLTTLTAPPCVDESVAITCGTDPSSLTVQCEDNANNCARPVQCGACEKGACGPKGYHEPLVSGPCVATIDCFLSAQCIAGQCRQPYYRSCQ